MEGSALHHHATEDVRIRGGRSGSPSDSAEGRRQERKLDVAPVVREGSFRGEKPRYPRTGLLARTTVLLQEADGVR